MAKKADTVSVVSLKNQEYISTGMPELDELITGWPRGRITELWGNPGTGKSYVLARTLAALQDKQKAIYYDTEFALYKPRLEQLGVELTDQQKELLKPAVESIGRGRVFFLKLG